MQRRRHLRILDTDDILPDKINWQYYEKNRRHRNGLHIFNIARLYNFQTHVTSELIALKHLKVWWLTKCLCTDGYFVHYAAV